MQEVAGRAHRLATFADRYYHAFGLRLLPSGCWFIVLALCLPRPHLMPSSEQAPGNVMFAHSHNEGVIPMWVALALLPFVIYATWMIHTSYVRRWGSVTLTRSAAPRSWALVAVLLVTLVAIRFSDALGLSPLAPATGIMTAGGVALFSSPFWPRTKTLIVAGILGCAVAAVIQTMPGDVLVRYGAPLVASSLGAGLILAGLVDHRVLLHELVFARASPGEAGDSP